MRNLIAILLGLLLAAPAFGQSAGTLNLIGPSSTPGAAQITRVDQLNGPINAALAAKADAANPVLTGILTAPVGTFTTIQLNGVPAAGLGQGGPAIIPTVTFDHSLGPADVRQHMFQTTLSPSSNTSNIWENVNSFLYLNGPGQANGEINLFHAFFQNNLGATASATETYESSVQNYGTIGQFDNYLALFHNQSTGTVNTVLGLVFGLTNDNPTALSVGNYAAISCGAMAGAGSLPLNEYCIQNKNPTGLIASLGPMSVGSLSTFPSTLLTIAGPDTSGGTFPINVKNSAGSLLFNIADNNTAQFGGTLTIGTSGSVQGGVTWNGLTGGQAIKVIAATGTAGIQVLTLPDVTDTIAVKATSQTFTATQTFSGTLNASGVLQGNGVTAVACASGAVSAATMVVSNGIVTHC